MSGTSRTIQVMGQSKKRSQAFGSGWTELKLETVLDYLRAYVVALKNKPFDLWYIDAFAGSGYRVDPDSRTSEAQLDSAVLEDLQQVNLRQVFEGSPSKRWTLFRRSLDTSSSRSWRATAIRFDNSKPNGLIGTSPSGKAMRCERGVEEVVPRYPLAQGTAPRSRVR